MNKFKIIFAIDRAVRSKYRAKIPMFNKLFRFPGRAEFSQKLFFTTFKRGPDKNGFQKNQEKFRKFST